MLTKQQRELFQRRKTLLTEEVTTLRERSRQKERLEQELIEFQNIMIEIKEEELQLRQAKLYAVKSQNSKRVRDSELIKNSMEVASRIILPDSDMIPRFETTNGSRPETSVVVEIGDEVLDINLIEGVGVQENISSMTVVSVLTTTPYIKTLLWDEYYASINRENTAKLSGNLGSLFDGKVQVLIIEQKDEIVENCAYRLFEVTNVKGKATVITYDVDEEGNRTLVE